MSIIKFFTIFWVTALIVLTSNSCTNQNDFYKAHFYTSIPNTEGVFTLLIDDQNRGELKHNQDELYFSTPGLDTLTLIFPLKYGRHDIKILNEKAELVVNGNFSISNRQIKSSSTGKEGIRTNITKTNDWVIFRVNKK